MIFFNNEFEKQAGGAVDQRKTTEVDQETLAAFLSGLKEQVT